MSLDEPIYRDSRGEIRRYEIRDVKFNVLFTKKGALRSGDYHPVEQYDLILKGKVKITLRKNGKDEIIQKGANELVTIPKNIPHLFEFLEDTIMLEWWSGPFEVEYYKPYRKFVEEQFEDGK